MTLQEDQRGMRVSVGGLVLVRQRPHTAKGMVFLTIEDETGATNVVMGPDVYARCRAAVRTAAAVLVHGVVQRHGDVVHLRAHFVEAMPTVPDTSEGLGDQSRAFC